MGRPDQMHGGQFNGVNGVGIGQGPGKGGYISFDGVGQCVHPGAGNELFGQGKQEPGIDNGNIRHDRPAENGHFHAPTGIGNDGKLADIRTGTGRGRQTDHGRNRLGDEVAPFVVVNPAVVGGQDADALGRVNGAAAAQGHDHIAFLFQIEIDADFDLEIPRVAYHVVIKNVFQILFFKVFDGLIQPSGLYHPRISDQKNPLTSQAPGALPDYGQRSYAVNDLRNFKFKQTVIKVGH